MKNKTYRILTFFCLIVGLFTLGCQQDEYFSDSSIDLQFSNDTIKFDTLFSALGSTTYYFKVYNPSNKNLNIDEIRLMGGENSDFKLNIDGRATWLLNNVRIAKKDSLYIMAEVRKNRQLYNQDSIAFTIGDKQQLLQVRAYSRDAFILNDSVLQNGYIFTEGTPYLILGDITIAEGDSATIDAGAELFFNNTSHLYVNGKLNIKEQPGKNKAWLTFIRYYNSWYTDSYGQWEGIVIGSQSIKNTITGARITGANNAIYVEDTLGVNTEIQLQLSKTIIERAVAGITGKNARIAVDNSLIADCNRIGVNLTKGSYQFFHNTITSAERRPLLRIDSSASAEFGNCIISRDYTGTDNTSISIGNDVQNYKFNHCILKVSSTWDTSDPNHYVGVITDSLPRFVNGKTSDFRLSKESPAIGKGNPSISAQYPEDIVGSIRRNDIGAYSYIEE
jgi:hypothetical protein